MQISENDMESPLQEKLALSNIVAYSYRYHADEINATLDSISLETRSWMSQL